MASLNPRIAAQLKRVPDIAVDAARRAMEEGATEIVAAMKAAAPEKSGELRDSIGWTWGDLPPGTFMIDEIRSGRNRGDQYATLRLKIYAGSKDAFYARFVEFGTQAHSLAGGADVSRNKRQGQGSGHPGAAAQPFFYPTWKAARVKFKRRIRERVRAAIREAWKNG
ncbi:HK97-gp10 family putative phage morphogenesis protein [uncultured Paracoccus sp.]|uniref:HK97-gp10 family putative phage morphogenesis protein n=1 Tax=uncultured Paracoccus sp. TaxID=189685 RepID=UPI0025DE7576|nr:HK97-gp10 family putative phage morphogenesis protein [uncultured Paracoccus sp.]